MRPLHFPLNRNADIESTTPDEPIDLVDITGFPVDSDERVDIVLNLSLNEYVAIASSIDVGRDIAYGTDSIFLWWLWVRSLQSLSICDSIIACIDDPESGVADAIVNLYNTQLAQSAIDSAQTTGDNILGDGNNPLCDKDIFWGGVNNLVDSLETNNADALQILEVLTNSGEWVAQVFAGALGIEAPLIQSGLDWATFIQQSILENYEAEITTQYLDTLKCDLFCIGFETCTLTNKQLIDYFYGRLQAVLTFESLLEDSLQYIFTGNWSGTEIADVMFLSQLAFRAQFGSWFESIGFNSLDMDMRLGFDDPSTDWILLCEDCLDDIIRLSGDGNDEMTALPFQTSPLAVYNAGEDIYEGTISVGFLAKFINIEYEFAVPTLLTDVLFSINYRRPDDEPTVNLAIMYFDDVEFAQISLPHVTEETQRELEWSGSETVTVIRILSGINTTVGDDGVLNLIKLVAVTG